MAKASAVVDIPFSAAEVWQLVGGFNSLPDWLPFITASELSEGGRVRHLTTGDGEKIVERLMSYDEEERRYSYHIVQSPFPQTDYLATLRVTETGDDNRAHVEWFGQFKPDGVADDVVETLFQGIYDGGLQGLKAHFDRRLATI